MDFFKVLIFIFFIGVSFNAFTQSNESMREGNIKTQSVWITERVNLQEKKYKKQELRFNKNGSCIEEIVYNKKGKIILHKSYSYNKNMLEREIYFNSKGFIISRIDYRYRSGILTEKIIYNGKGEVIRNEQMIYEYQD
jgi:hypothetical protein